MQNYNAADWSCQQCTYLNKGEGDICAVCRFRHTLDTENPPIVQSYLDKSARPIQQNAKNNQDEELRIVIIGKTGTGKSATGNTILGENIFESKACGTSVTNECKLGINKRFDRKIVLVDTPGLFDTEMTNDQVTKEIVKCIGMTAPGPHVILLTVNIGRFTKEEQDTVKHFVDHFGDQMYNYLLVVFTRADDLENENTAIESFVNGGPPELKAILHQCNNRYVAFNNRLRGINQEHQVKRLISIIDDIVRRNGGRYFTNEMYEEAEKTLLRQEQEMQKKLQEEEERTIEEIRHQLRTEFDKKFDVAKYENDQLVKEISEHKNEMQREEAKTRDMTYQISYLKDQLRECKREEQENQLVEMIKGLEKCQMDQRQMEKSRMKDERIQQLEKQIRENDKRREKEIQMLKEEIKRKEQLIRDECKQRQNPSNLRDVNRKNLEKETGIFSMFGTFVKGAFKIASTLAVFLPNTAAWGAAKMAISAVGSILK